MVELHSFPANEAMARSLVEDAGPDAPGGRHPEARRPVGRRRRSLGHPGHCAVSAMLHPKYLGTRSPSRSEETEIREGR